MTTATDATADATDREPALVLAERVDTARVDPSADGGIDITVTGDLKRLDVEHADSIHRSGDLGDMMINGPIKGRGKEVGRRARR